MYHTPRLLYNSNIDDNIVYHKLYDQLSNQAVSRPVLEFKIRHNTDTAETKTFANIVKPELTEILRQLSSTSRTTMSLLTNTLYVTKEYDNYRITYEYLEIMTDMSQKYLEQLLDFINSNKHSVAECKNKLSEHSRNIGYHVKHAIKPTQLQKIYWRQKDNTTWAITLGFLHGTLIKKDTDSYILYINSKDKTVLCNKQRKILSEETIENIKAIAIKLMRYELERYERRINTTRYLFETFKEPVKLSPNTIFNNIYRAEDTLPYHQAHIFSSIRRSDDDIFHEYKQHVNNKLKALHERFGKSEEFTFFGYGESTHRTKYETIYTRTVDFMENKRLNYLLPNTDDCDDYDIRYHNNDVIVNMIQLHGNSTMTYRIIPTTEDTNEIQLTASGLWCGNDPNAIQYIEKHTLPIGPILKAL